MGDSAVLSLVRIFSEFCWFVSMSMGGVLDLITPCAIMVPIFLVAFPFIFLDGGFFNWRRDFSVKLGIAILPIFWSVSGILGAAFRYDGERPNHGFLSYLLIGIFIGFWGYGVFAVAHNKKYRGITTAFVLLNGYFVLTISFIAGMSITGTWL